MAFFFTCSTVVRVRFYLALVTILVFKKTDGVDIYKRHSLYQMLHNSMSDVNKHIGLKHSKKQNISAPGFGTSSGVHILLMKELHGFCLFWLNLKQCLIKQLFVFEYCWKLTQGGLASKIRMILSGKTLEREPIEKVVSKM